MQLKFETNDCVIFETLTGLRSVWKTGQAH